MIIIDPKITFTDALNYFNGDKLLLRKELGDVSRQVVYNWKKKDRLPSDKVLMLQQYVIKNDISWTINTWGFRLWQLSAA